MRPDHNTYYNSTGSAPSHHLSSIHKLTVAFLAMMMIVTAGTVGFMATEDLALQDSIYLTIITLSTVGYGDVIPTHSSGKLIAIFLVIFGVVLAAYSATALAQLILEGHFKEFYGRKKMENKIKKLREHNIIVGFGRVGYQVGLEFEKQKVPFVVIERDPQSERRLTSGRFLFIEGEAIDEDILRQAGIENAHTLISTLPDEAQNVYLTLTARDINPKLKIIARADFEGGEKKLLRAGADHVVSPHVIGGNRMAMASLRPNVVDFMRMTALGEGGLSIEELVLPETCKIAGKTLVESKLKDNYGVTVIGIKRIGEKMTIYPQPDWVFQVSDTMVLIGPNEGLEQLENDLGN